MGWESCQLRATRVLAVCVVPGPEFLSFIHLRVLGEIPAELVYTWKVCGDGGGVDSNGLLRHGTEGTNTFASILRRH